MVRTLKELFCESNWHGVGKDIKDIHTKISWKLAQTLISLLHPDSQEIFKPPLQAMAGGGGRPCPSSSDSPAYYDDAIRCIWCCWRERKEKKLKLFWLHCSTRFNLESKLKCLYLHMYLIWNTVRSQVVDRSTIQFWTLLAKGHSIETSNFPFIISLKILECATNRDSLLLMLVTLR